MVTRRHETTGRAFRFPARQGFVPWECGLLLGAPTPTRPSPPRPAGQWTLSSGFDYTTGKYGQSSPTDILTIPAIAPGMTTTAGRSSSLGAVDSRIRPGRWGPGCRAAPSRRRGVQPSRPNPASAISSQAGNLQRAQSHRMRSAWILPAEIKFGTASATRALAPARMTIRCRPMFTRPSADLHALWHAWLPHSWQPARLGSQQHLVCVCRRHLSRGHAHQESALCWICRKNQATLLTMFVELDRPFVTHDFWTQH